MNRESIKEREKKDLSVEARFRFVHPLVVEELKERFMLNDPVS
jgi:hypothetical protein